MVSPFAGRGALCAADRNAVDTRIINEVRTRTGRLIDSVSAVSGKPEWPDPDKSAGGWPVLAKNTRKLILPANLNGDNECVLRQSG